MYLVSHIHSLRVNTPPISCTWLTHPVSSVTPCLRYCTWCHMVTVSNVTPLFHLGSHIRRFQGDIPLRPCSWGYTSSLQYDPISPNFLPQFTWPQSPVLPHISDPVPGVTCSWWPGLQPSPEAVPGVTWAQSPGLPKLPDPVPGVTQTQSPR